jgi:pimeloyl-ACP methyl ester carboxylesterase
MGTVVALHGAGMTAGYFDGQAHPDLSLLTLGASLGYNVVAVDRPGYGRSAVSFPEGQGVSEQADILRSAIGDLVARYDVGRSLSLVAHSFGGKVALALAAGPLGDELTAVDIAGCGHRYRGTVPGEPGAGRHPRKGWGPLRFYPPGSFRAAADVVRPVPSRELADTGGWSRRFEDLSGGVRVPIRFTFSEDEPWWRQDSETLAELRSQLARAPRVVIDRQSGCGHNLSLGWAARSYHFRALGFVAECAAHETTTTPDHGRSENGTDDPQRQGVIL